MVAFDPFSYIQIGTSQQFKLLFIWFQNYIDEKAYQAAHHTDLWSAMQAEADKQGLTDRATGDSLNIKNILDTWILQMGRL